MLAVHNPGGPLSFRSDGDVQDAASDIPAFGGGSPGGLEPNLRRERQDDGVGEQHRALVQELRDLRDVRADFLALESFKAALAATQSGDVRHLGDLIAREEKGIDVDVRPLPGPQGAYRELGSLHRAPSRSLAT